MIAIQSAVCNHFGIELAALVSKDRSKSLAFARQLAVYLCRTVLGMSYPELGRAFGGRDHTTMLAACRRIERVCSVDRVAKAHLTSVIHALGTAQGAVGEHRRAVPERTLAPSPDYRIAESEATP